MKRLILILLFVPYLVFSQIENENHLEIKFMIIMEYEGIEHNGDIKKGELVSKSTSFNFIEDGKILSNTYNILFEDGEDCSGISYSIYSTDYAYNKKGLLISYNSCPNAESWCDECTYKYDQYDNLIESVCWDPDVDSCIFKYNSQNLLIEKQCINECDPEYHDTCYGSFEIYKYQKKKVIEIKHYSQQYYYQDFDNSIGELDRIERFKYDDKGNKILEIQLDANGNIIRKVESEYDFKGNKVLIIDSLYRVTRTEFTYNFNNDWIKRVESPPNRRRAEIFHHITERDIEYYKNDDTSSYGIIDDPDGYTNVRKSNSSKSNIVFKIYDNQIFKIISSIGDWTLIEYNGRKGYMHSSRIFSLD